MSPWGHFVAALPLAGGLYALGVSAPEAAAAMAAGVLVDVDHVADYLWLKKGRFKIRSFYEEYREHLTGRLILIFHSWELAAVAVFAFWLWSAPSWAWCLAAGWVYHLLCDQATNRVGLRFYFLCFRAARGFRRSALPCPQGRPQP